MTQLRRGMTLLRKNQTYLQVHCSFHIPANWWIAGHVGIVGINDFSNFIYSGPCPNLKEHHYYFKVYALNKVLELSILINCVQLEKAMSESIVAFGEIMGSYARGNG